jgi:isocitrate dehydrogenase (NAD+)
VLLSIEEALAREYIIVYNKHYLCMVDNQRVGRNAMTYTITLMPGDGIGPEVTRAAVTVLEAAGVPICWDEQALVPDSHGGFPEGVAHSLRANRLGLKGPTATEGHRSLNVGLREALGLYANVRPVVSMPGVHTRFDNAPIDILLFRENQEDLYIGEEVVRDGGDTVLGISRFTRAGCERFARFAFTYAKMHGRRRMTIVHKANILKLTHGLFLKTAREIAEEFPEIECDALIADNCLMQLVMRPERFDCLLLPNFIGDLASDLCAGLVGGLGFAAGINIGDGIAVAEAVHGTAPDIAGKNIANPSSLILSGALLLDYMEESKAADAVRFAVEDTLCVGKYVTADVNSVNPMGTQEYADIIAEMVKRSLR